MTGGIDAAWKWEVVDATPRRGLKSNSWVTGDAALHIESADGAGECRPHQVIKVIATTA